MKIRIKGNSVRLRLTKTDVEIFNKEGECKESTEFGSKKLHYSLQVKTGISTLEADFVGDVITVYFPESEKQTWADFTCLDNTIEDQSDNFPNPKLNA